MTSIEILLTILIAQTSAIIGGWIGNMIVKTYLEKKRNKYE